MALPSFGVGHSPLNIKAEVVEWLSVAGRTLSSVCSNEWQAYNVNSRLNIYEFPYEIFHFVAYNLIIRYHKLLSCQNE